MNGAQLLHHALVAILESADPAENFAEIQRFHGNSAGLQKLLAVADGVERRRPRAHGTDAQILQPSYHPTYTREPFQILGKLGGVRTFGVQRGQRIRNAILPQIVADRHLSAKAVAPVSD